MLIFNSDVWAADDTMKFDQTRFLIWEPFPNSYSIMTLEFMARPLIFATFIAYSFLKPQSLG